MTVLCEQKVKNFMIKDFKKYPVWCWDGSNEFLCPIIMEGNQLPDQYGSLFVAADFLTDDGVKFSGYIIGHYSVYGFGLFYNEKVYEFNLNLPKFALKEWEMLKSDMQRDVVLFPLKYWTKYINSDGELVVGVLDVLLK